MKTLPMERLGPHESPSAPGVVHFGVLLPWISAQDGNRLFVKIIHELDQFVQAVQPMRFELQQSMDPDYGEYWSATLDFNSARDPQPGSHFGKAGSHVYRYELHNPNVGVLDWIVDPFAREFAVGKLSSFTLGYIPHAWSEQEAAWQTPALRDLILYEMNIAEFGDNLTGAIARLDYVADMGVNALSVMPVTNVALEVDWGYLPLGYFGVDERFGNRKDFQRFVDEAHQRGLAVIVDAVYGHTSKDFPYADLYQRLQYHENPFMGSFAKDYFGVSTDFSRMLTRDFFYTVNTHWLGTYHVDGFRYDCVPNYWDGATGVGYANLVFNTYEYVKGALPQLPRFAGPEGPRIIQIAEQLEAPEQILEQTYSNATWQDASYAAADACAHGADGALAALGMRFGAAGYVEQESVNGDTLPKAPLQYIENHDHKRFLWEFTQLAPGTDPMFADADRSRWYQVQPYLIALLAAKGIPMLWQGQEFGENYFLPESGLGRVMMLRPMRWDYFYDEAGKNLVRLTRKMVGLRKQLDELRHGDHYFYNDYDKYVSHGVLMFRRKNAGATSLVAVNFTGAEQTVPFTFEDGGYFAEQLHGEDNFTVSPGQQHWLTIPSNYGRVWRSA